MSGFDSENIDTIKKWLEASPYDTGVHAKEDVLKRLEACKLQPSADVVRDIADGIFTAIGGVMPNSPKREGAPLTAIKKFLEEAKAKGLAGGWKTQTVLNAVTPKENEIRPGS